ncbi:MAG: MFS transporter [Gammaproteobacteria bacterium]|nr:MFS transporter [Gammaproteobacteria bacterium]MCW5584425.1 MFS transporter [Gammaproteobacteria bacterium]
MSKYISSTKNSIIGQIIAIFFIEISSSAAFAVFFSGLSLYLTQKEIHSEYSATLITGLFLSLNYFLPFIGGSIANTLISCKKLYCLGTLLSLAGCSILAFGNNLYLGLSLFLMSSLVTNVCLKMFITDLFDESQVKERRAAFMWSYAGMNAGFLMGYFISGYSTNHNSYTNLFMFMGVLLAISIGLTLLFITDNQSIKYKKSNINQLLSTSLLLTLVVLLINFLLKFAAVTEKYITWITISGMLCLVCYGYSKINIDERIKYLKFISYSTLTILFWSLYMLTPIAFMQLIDHDVERNIVGITLAPQWFMNADAIIILMIAPVLAILMNKSKSKTKSGMNNISYFVLAFTFCIFALLILLGGFSQISNLKIPAWSMLGCLVMLAIGEIFVSPIGDSLIGELIPSSMRAMMTGYWSMNIGIGALLATSISNTLLLPYINKNGLIDQNLVNIQQNITIICTGLFILTLSIFIYNQLVIVRNNFKLGSGKSKSEVKI